MLNSSNSMTIDELDNVSGGNYDETINDGRELLARGLWSEKYPAGFTKIDLVAKNWAPEIETVLAKRGYKYVANKGISGSYTGFDHPNEYYDRAGNRVSRAEFWHNFA